MIDYTETGCEVGRWMKLAQNRVQWRALGIGDVHRTGSAIQTLFQLLTSSFACAINKQMCYAKSVRTHLKHVCVQPEQPFCFG
jgi:hypothetical protein